MAKRLTGDSVHSIESALCFQIVQDARAPAKAVASLTGTSRLTVQKILNRMVAEGYVVAEGKTRGQRYRLVTAHLNRVTVPLRGLDESAVWREHFQRFFAAPGSTAMSLAQYAATEMINNAIDHSDGTQVSIAARREGSCIVVIVHDDGVGAFRKIQEHFALDTIQSAVLELAKGKLTTDPKRHSGLGIFFSSRACSAFILAANGLTLHHRITGRDYLFETDLSAQGTLVHMEFPLRSTMTTDQLFKKYEVDGQFGFSRTVVPLRLAEIGEDILVSRSQAKRVLSRVEKFREVILDFEGIDSIGQAFADEIFRVFPVEHPEILFKVMGANENIDRMIALALAARAESSAEEIP
jgi:anti-sigma regulatory factor (Ser/Thr protein kinase)